MDTLIVCTAAALVVTKALDCLTTLRGIRSAAAETNAIARSLMQRIGIRRAVALIFVLALGCIYAAAAYALYSEQVVWRAGFVVIGLAISIVQAAVAHTNHTGRDNPITRRVRRMHKAIPQRVRRMLSS